MVKKPDNWNELTPEEKRTYRLEKFRNSGREIQFVSSQAEKNYNIRVKRLIDVYNLQKPDRVPLSISAGNLPLTMAGLNTRALFYEPQKVCEAMMRFNEKYSEELETFAMPMMVPGEVMDILDYKLYLWPGHGLPTDADGWQYIEGEYMTADEYDDLIRDPSDFWLRKYLPRVLGSFEGFSMFQPFTNITENLHILGLKPLSTAPVRKMLETLLQAGEAFEKNNASLARYANMGVSYGFPSFFGMFCKAPFDMLGDTLRGTTNIMKDMFRRPEKLLAALNVIAEISIANVLNSPSVDDVFMVNYPLHKGADGWMSQEQFDKFYWPSLKKCIDAFVKEGLLQWFFAEGSYNTRLEYINKFPKGSVTWFFDKTDMVRAKQILEKECSIQGNVPASMIVTGEPADVYAYCRKLIEVVGKDGGFILSPGAQPGNPKLENLQAMVKAVNDYGYYK